MRIREMLSCHIVLLLLAWRCGEVSGGEDTIGEEIDQVATASVVRIHNTTANHSTLEKPFRDVEITTIRYENSNGFVPITQETQTVTGEDETAFGEKYSVDRNFTSEEHLSLFIKNPEYSEDEKSLENDPIYSTEARIFLSLTQPILNRRSSDFQESSDDFELLRINNDTPTIANYENFYNSLSGTNQRPRNVGGEVEDQNIQPDFYQDRRNIEREKNYFDNRGQSKKIESYLSSYGDNGATRSPKNVAVGSQYFSYSQIHEDRNENGHEEPGRARDNFPTVDTFDYNPPKKGKVSQNYRATQQQNYDQHDVANYQFNPQSSQKVETPTDVNNYQRRPKQKSSQNTNRSRINVKQHVPSKMKSVSNVRSNLDNISPRSQNYNVNTRSEESPSYFEHEALFNRDEGNHNYEKIEDPKELSDENYEYVEITEKPKRFRKQRKRPSDHDDSKRLPKEHRDFDDSIDIDESARPRTRPRSKIRNDKSKANAWSEPDSSIHEDESDEGGFETAVVSTVNPKTRKPKFYNHNRNPKPKGNSWANVSPNVEISHSSGIEIDQVGKPKLVLPVKVNLVPLANFDHATALGNSQGFDLSNAVLQNFVTATPITFSNSPPVTPITSILNTPHGIYEQNMAKTLQSIQNHNVKVQTPVPEVIVGQNSFQNPIQTILVPQQNKFGQNVRNTFLSNNQNSYVQNPISNQNVQPSNFNLLQQNLQPQNVQANLPVQNQIYNPSQSVVQSFQNPNVNQIQNVHSTPQFNNPHPTPQTFENFPLNNGQSISNYNMQVNPHGLQSQTSPATQNLFNLQSNLGFSTTPSTNYLHNGNSDNAGIHGKRNMGTGSNGQFLASASLTVGEQIQNQMNAQNLRPQIQDNFNHVFRHDSLLPKTKGLVQNTDASQNFMNFHNQNGQGAQILNRDHQTEQISQASNAIAQTYKDQNQQILKVANEIFESTLKQLKQLQRTQSLRPNRLSYQNSQNLDNNNFQNLGTKNVEILNPTESANSFGGLSLTTAFPIFATTSFDATPRPPTLSTIGPLSVHGYVNSLTEIGAKENDQKTSPTTNLKLNPSDQRLEPVLFNPINFVPNLDTLKNQKALNNKYHVHEPLLQDLNMVPLIPGGNFYKNSYFAQEDLISKPKLSSDLQKYAEEMFKESLKTIYNTQKWNNDHKAQGSEISSVTTSPKGKDDLHNMKFSLPDIKPSKQILEAHFSETGSKHTGSQSLGHSSKPTEELTKPSQALDSTDILKPDFKLPSPISLEPVRFYYKPNIHLGRPTISDTSHPDFKFNPDFGTVDYIHDFLTPPKPNAFVSKSPFNEPMPKRRPGHKRPISDNGGGKFHGRPEGGPVKHPPGVVEAAASNIAHQSFSFDTPRYEFLRGKPSFDHETEDFDVDYQNSYSGMRGQSFYSKYPSLTTSSPFSNDYHKPSSHNYDYNHPRMHNLMGLLRKNKRLPPGNSQSLFIKKEGVEEPFGNDQRQDKAQVFRESSRSFAEDRKESGIENLETKVNSTETEKSHA